MLSLAVVTAWISVLAAPAGEATTERRFGGTVVDSSSLGARKVVLRRRPEGFELKASIDERAASSSPTDVEVRARCQVGAQVFTDVARVWQEGNQPIGTRTARLFASPYGDGAGPLSAKLKQASRCELEFRASDKHAFALACWSAGRTKPGPCRRRITLPKKGTAPGAFIGVDIDTVPVSAGTGVAVRAEYGVWKAAPWGTFSRYESRLSCLVEGRWLTETHPYQRLEGAFFEQEAGETWVGEDRFFRNGHLSSAPAQCNLELIVRANDHQPPVEVLQRESCWEDHHITAQACADHPKPSGPGSPVDHRTVSVPAVFLKSAPALGFSGSTDSKTREAIETHRAKNPSPTTPSLELILTLERPIAGEPAFLRGEADCDFDGTSHRESVEFLFQWASYTMLRAGESQLVQRAIFYKGTPAATPERCEVELWLGDESKSDPANIPLGRWCRATSADPMTAC